MEETGELLFLLSSQERRNLLSALRDERLRLSRLSSKFAMTAQETSRQLTRLQGANLVERDSKGLYTITNLGRLALKLLPSFQFLVSNSDYLRTHDLSFLSPEFVERLGELAENEHSNGLGDILNHFEEVLRESRDHVWLMADQILLFDSVIKKMTSGDQVSMKIVIPRAAIRNAEYEDIPSEFRGRVEVGLVEEVKVGLALNEKIAGVTFPDNNGTVDFDRGFRGANAPFHRWCSDLFLSQWNLARKVF